MSEQSALALSIAGIQYAVTLLGAKGEERRSQLRIMNPLALRTRTH